VLDLGCGYGKYTVLVREYMDIAKFRIKREDWQTSIVGVEAFEAYRNPVWDACDEVLIEDFTKHYEAYRGFDLVLMIDSLEHVEKSLGEKILNTLLTNNKWVIVSCPDGDYPQGAVNGNEYETHRAVWTKEDLSIRGGHILHHGICTVALFKGKG
jgi:SAM-dependent methyltransferase